MPLATTSQMCPVNRVWFSPAVRTTSHNAETIAALCSSLIVIEKYTFPC